MKQDTAKKYDLEERTRNFALDVRKFIRRLPAGISNRVDIEQLAKASGSVGANYIEANESLSEKDYLYRVKLCRKETKECRFFIKIVDINNDPDLKEIQDKLIRESTELMNIFGAIVRKIERRKKFEFQNPKSEKG